MAPPDEFSVGATVIAGRLQLTDPDEYRMRVAELPEGLCVEVTVTAESEHRPKTDQQRKYFHAVPVPLCADECGNTERQMSRDLMAECFGYEMNRFGKMVPIETSFAALTVEKAKELIDWVIDWAPRELGVVVPPPDKDWRKNADIIRRQRRRVA
jgi:hypothetical protein